MLEIIEHEAIVCEAYKDSVGRWTWGIGVTDASGHEVYPRYRKNPSSIARCLEVYEWLLRDTYLPPVLKAFAGRELTEAQLGAALSFHWNTGAIGRADWVTSWLRGDSAKAHRDFLNWCMPREIIGRRKAERALFFDEVWTSDGFVLVYDRVDQGARATPIWSSARQIDIRPVLKAVCARAGAA
ncbi:MAG: hypothetical protein WBA68_10170 [Alteraurantiacibacter sp.]